MKNNHRVLRNLSTLAFLLFGASICSAQNRDDTIRMLEARIIALEARLTVLEKAALNPRPTSTSPKQHPIVGKWEPIEPSNKGWIQEFKADGTVLDTFGGKRNATAKYTILDSTRIRMEYAGKEAIVMNFKIANSMLTLFNPNSGQPFVLRKAE